MFELNEYVTDKYMHLEKNKHHFMFWENVLKTQIFHNFMILIFSGLYFKASSRLSLN